MNETKQIDSSFTLTDDDLRPKTPEELEAMTPMARMIEESIRKAVDKLESEL